MGHTLPPVLSTAWCCSVPPRLQPAGARMPAPAERQNSPTNPTGRDQQLQSRCPAPPPTLIPPILVLPNSYPNPPVPALPSFRTARPAAACRGWPPPAGPPSAPPASQPAGWVVGGCWWWSSVVVQVVVVGWRWEGAWELEQPGNLSGQLGCCCSASWQLEAQHAADTKTRRGSASGEGAC